MHRIFMASTPLLTFCSGISSGTGFICVSGIICGLGSLAGLYRSPVVNFPNIFVFFPSYNHCSLGDGYHCSGNQTCMAPREGPLPVSMVAPRCDTHDIVLHHCRCPMDRGLRIHCRVFRFMDRASGLHFTRPIPPPAVV